MRNLKDVYFGCIDADTEASRKPDVFQAVFFDPLNHVDELIDGDKFIIRGRKGDGKTAYSAKIKLMKDSTSIRPVQKSLSDFDNSTFEIIKTNPHFTGNLYVSFWKCIIMIECAKMIYENQPHISEQNFVDLIGALDTHGLLKKGNNISHTIKRLVETNTALSIHGFGHKRKYQHQKNLHGAEEIYSAICRTLEPLHSPNDKFILIIDGLDDVLHHLELSPDIIIGLLRATQDINTRFAKANLSLKVLLLIRDDIFDLCIDPNISKMKYDSAIPLSWEVNDDRENSSLIQLVKKRFHYTWGTDDAFLDIWRELFVESIDGKTSFEYVLENMRYRPRDILQFFAEAQKVYQPHTIISAGQLKTILSNYSKGYFYDAMTDELAGFFSGHVVRTLPQVLGQLRSHCFYLAAFDEECKKRPEFENISAAAILKRLFDCGFVGQYRSIAGRDTDYVVFSYRNQRERFIETDQCIVHRGLQRALTLL